MLTITTPADAAQTIATATETPGYVTLTHLSSTLTLPTLPRPGNYSETIYLVNDVLQFEPGASPTIAAVLACSAGQTSLALFPVTIPGTLN